MAYLYELPCVIKRWQPFFPGKYDLEAKLLLDTQIVLITMLTAHFMTD